MSFSYKKVILLFCFLAIGIISLKAEEPVKDQQPWTIARVEHEFGGDDPIGGYNRVVYTITDYGMRYLIKPITIGYATILPRPVIKMIDNACNNLMFPRKYVTCLGSKEWDAANDELCRFLINTTLGVAGLFDPARNWFHFYNTHSDFGMMFSSWGIEPGCTFMFPFIPYTNVRDMVGGIFDYFFDGRTYLPFTSWTYLNYVAIIEPSYADVMHGAADRYHTFRSVMLAKRELEKEMWTYHKANQLRELQKEREAHPEPPPEDVIPAPVPGVRNPVHIPCYEPDSPMLDTLRVLRFRPQEDKGYWFSPRSLFNTDFPNQAKHRSVETAPDKSYEYLFWKPDPQKHPVRKQKELVLLLPGIGAHNNGTVVLAMSEQIRNSGRWTVTVSSTFTTEFMKNAGGGELPGYTPRDAANMKSLLEKIVRDLKEDEYEFDRIHIVGWSFGGVHALFMADLCGKDTASPLHNAHFLAINPPVDYQHAMKTADDLAACMNGWSREKAGENIKEAVGHYLLTGEGTMPLYEDGLFTSVMYRVPVTEDQAKILVYLSFCSGIRDILLTAHQEKPFPALKTGTEMPDRMALLEEIDRVTFTQYAKEFLKPRLASSLTLEELIQKSGLRAIESVLKNNPRIRVIHSANDFLLSQEDRIWLSDTLGDKLVWFDQGGHMGYLYTKIAQDKILELLEQ